MGFVFKPASRFANEPSVKSPFFKKISQRSRIFSQFSIGKARRKLLVGGKRMKTFNLIEFFASLHITIQNTVELDVYEARRISNQKSVVFRTIVPS